MIKQYGMSNFDIETQFFFVLYILFLYIKIEMNRIYSIHWHLVISKYISFSQSIYLSLIDLKKRCKIVCNRLNKKMACKRIYETNRQGEI